MSHSSSALISAEEASGDRAGATFQSIVGVIPFIGALLGVLFKPIVYFIGSFFGWLSGAEINEDLLQTLPNNSLKNAYVAAIVGFFLVVNLTGKLIPILSPVAVLVGAITAIIFGISGALFGYLADLAGGLQPQ